MGLEHIVFKCPSVRDDGVIYGVLDEVSRLSFFPEVRYIYSDNISISDAWSRFLEKNRVSGKYVVFSISDLGDLAGVLSEYIRVFRNLIKTLDIGCHPNI